jgi:hypothetical protein
MAGRVDGQRGEGAVAQSHGIAPADVRRTEAALGARQDDRDPAPDVRGLVGVVADLDARDVGDGVVASRAGGVVGPGRRPQDGEEDEEEDVDRFS